MARVKTLPICPRCAGLTRIALAPDARPSPLTCRKASTSLGAHAPTPASLARLLRQAPPVARLPRRPRRAGPARPVGAPGPRAFARRRALDRVAGPRPRAAPPGRGGRAQEAPTGEAGAGPDGLAEPALGEHRRRGAAA